MTSELDVLKIVATRLEAAKLPYMLTGSFAMAYYTTPRMTRDLDIVVALKVSDVDALVAQFSDGFYLDANAVRSSASVEGYFNLMHVKSGLKVNYIVRKSAPYRLHEFERRRRVTLGGVDCWIVTREDLVLSKLVWARETRSELQQRDVKSLIDGTIDWKYLRRWALELGVLDALAELPT